MDRFYEILGYSRMQTLDFELEMGSRKVVLYARVKDRGTIEEITHATIQEPNGLWSSKMGRGPLILHESPESSNGPFFGVPVAVYWKHEEETEV